MLFPSVQKFLHVWLKGFLLRNPFSTVSKGIGQKSIRIVPGEAEGGLVRSLGCRRRRIDLDPHSSITAFAIRRMISF
jgi:hypothetical protein